MSKITEIKQAKGKSKRLHIYLDNAYTCTIDEFTAYKHRLEVGREITLDQLEEITMESELSSGFEKAVDLISKTPKTKRQVYTYLKDKGYLPKLCHAVVEKLCEYHYVDDEAYTKMYVDTYLNKYGKRKIMFNLEQKGIKRDIIDNALGEIEGQTEVVANFAQKYMKGKEPTRENIDKLCRHLINKGFEWADINPIVSKIKSGEDYESWD